MRIFLRIVGLELLIIFFFTVNGAYVTLANPSNAFLKYAGLLPLAFGISFYLIKTKKWEDYFSRDKLKPIKDTILFCLPLLFILIVLFIGNGGIGGFSIYNIILVLVTQILVVAFIEEVVFRGFMLNILISKGFKLAVLTTSLLFAFTHSLQLLGGQSLEDTIIQVLYAFLIGIVLSLIIVNKQSIMIAIAFHGLNNTLMMIAQNNGSSVYNYILIAILIIYSVLFWFRALKIDEIKSEKIVT